MLKKLLYTFGLCISSASYANEPKDWQLGFQNPASQSMYEIVKFHDYMLVPIIVAISGFVLFLMAYTCIRFRASRNPNPSKRTHNVAVEILWTLIPCLILIVMAVPSFKILYSQDTISLDVIVSELSEAPSELNEQNKNIGISEAFDSFIRGHINKYNGVFPEDGLYNQILQEMERPLIAAVLHHTRGNQLKTAKILGLNRNTLRKKIRDLNLPVIRVSK